VRTYLVLYLLVALTAVPPLLSLVWPAFRAWYLGSLRWPAAQVALTTLAFLAVEVVSS
jgi:hypothetical protein